MGDGLGAQSAEPVTLQAIPTRGQLAAAAAEQSAQDVAQDPAAEPAWQRLLLGLGLALLCLRLRHPEGAVVGLAGGHPELRL